MAELSRTIGSRGRVRHVRDRAYFEWRYRNPLAAYRFLFWGGASLQGYLVLERSLSNLMDRVVVRISDWEAADRGIRATLLKATIQWGRFRELAAWSQAQPEGTADLLVTEGFAAHKERLSRQRSALLVQLTRAGANGDAFRLHGVDLLDLSNWELRLIDAL